jgi:outer membrane protein assembly factor BamB
MAPFNIAHKDLQVSIFNDTDYNPGSVDNSRSYNHVYTNKDHSDYLYLTKHGIIVYKNEELLNSALVISSGGATAIHETSFLIDNDTFLICCADSIFCLTLPELNLVWRTMADMATCFEIFKYQDTYIVHGELEISCIDKNGNIIWSFSGTDIFTTQTGKNTFRIIDNIIYATNWDNVIFQLNADTGQLIK